MNPADSSTLQLGLGSTQRVEERLAQSPNAFNR